MTNSARLSYDPSQAQHLAARLGRTHQVKALTFTLASNHSMAELLHQALTYHTLHLYPADGLLDELANIRLEETSGNRWKIETRPGMHDDMADTLAMALHYWRLQRKPERMDPEQGRRFDRVNRSMSVASSNLGLGSARK